MTDPLTRIDKLARVSRWEEPPPVDVSDWVLAAIRERETAYGYAPLQWIAAGSIAAAVAMTLSMVSLYQKWSDPVATLLLDIFQGFI
jgi:hypothetical protein